MNSPFVRQTFTRGFASTSCALFLFVAGTRLAVFSYAGSPLPYYDQWIAEFNSTYLSLSAGNGLGALLLNHNEHLILTTKILTLLGFSINGYWDITFLVLCSAGIRALTAVWCFQLIADSAQLRTKLLLWLLCAVVFAAPFSGFNLLNGMQVCFYLSELALLWSLRATTNWAEPLPSAVALIGGTLFGLASLTSAIAIPVCTLAVHFFLRRPRPGFWPAWIISAGITLGFIVARMHIFSEVSSQHAHQSIQTATVFWLQILAWPVRLAPVGALLAVLCAMFLLLARKSDKCRSAGNGAILGLGVYAVLNAGFIAVNRSPAEWQMRHWELNALFPLAILAFGWRLAELQVFKRPLLLVTGVVTLGCLLGAGNLVRTVNWPYLKAAHDTRSEALKHYQTVLQQHDFRNENERFYALGNRLGPAFIDDPIGRFSLHPVLLENLIKLDYRPLAFLSPEIIPVRSPSRFSWLTGHLIASGWLVGLLGIIMGVAAAVRRDDQPPTNANPS